MEIDPRDTARNHRDNRRKLELAINMVNRSLNEAIKSKDHSQEYVNTRILVILWVAWAENLLNVTLYGQYAHIPKDVREKILSARSETEKWRKLTEYFFRKHYLNGNDKKAIDIITVGHTAYYRWMSLNDLITNDIEFFVEIRNRLAHGQWAIAFNSDSTNKNQTITTRIWTLSKKDLIVLRNVLRNFVMATSDLVCSKATFEKKFDLYMARINEAKHNIDKMYDGVLKHLKEMARKKAKLIASGKYGLQHPLLSFAETTKASKT